MALYARFRQEYPLQLPGLRIANLIGGPGEGGPSLARFAAVFFFLPILLVLRNETKSPFRLSLLVPRTHALHLFGPLCCSPTGVTVRL